VQLGLVTWLRDIDRWLAEGVLPYAAEYRRLASRLVGPDEAADVVQDAYARLMAYERWREIEDPRAWCLRVVRNLASDRLRTADVVHIDRAARIETLDPADDRPDAFRVAAGRIDAERLLALLDRLPNQCARVVKMRKIEGRSPREIAVSLGLSVSTVEKHLAKGLALVAAGLRGDVGAETIRERPWVRRRTRN
jgi:RNA polymerase sigma factor (sigma-70 family)